MPAIDSAAADLFTGPGRCVVNNLGYPQERLPTEVAMRRAFAPASGPAERAELFTIWP
jgi:hypothetical protein